MEERGVGTPGVGSSAGDEFERPTSIAEARQRREAMRGYSDEWASIVTAVLPEPVPAMPAPRAFAYGVLTGLLGVAVGAAVTMAVQELRKRMV